MLLWEVGELDNGEDTQVAGFDTGPALLGWAHSTWKPRLTSS